MYIYIYIYSILSIIHILHIIGSDRNVRTQVGLFLSYSYYTQSKSCGRFLALRGLVKWSRDQLLACVIESSGLLFGSYLSYHNMDIA